MECEKVSLRAALMVWKKADAMVENLVFVLAVLMALSLAFFAAAEMDYRMVFSTVVL